MTEIVRYEMTPHLVKFEMYYSLQSARGDFSANRQLRR